MSADMATLPATRGGPKWSDILDQLWTRRIMQSPQMEVQRLISDHYGGRISIPLPEIDAEERPAVANIIAQVLDQHAMRIASVTPAKEVFPLRTGSQRDLKQARVQRRVLFDWDDNNAMNRFDRRRARWLVGFGQAPVLIRPNAVTRAPSWELRNPLGTYPTPVRPYDDMTPDDCIFTYVRTFGWLQQRYPNLSDVLNTTQPANRKYRADTRLEVIEYVDGEVLVLGVLGGGIVPPYALLAQMGYTVLPVPSNAAGQVYAIELERVANLAERCTAIIPNRITLDALKGQLDDMIGIYQMEAKMMALQVNAVAQAIYPDTWFVEAPQGGGEIVTMADGLKGIVGHVRGGSIEQQGKPLGAQTMPVVATLERNAGMSGAATPEFSGECADEDTEILTANGWLRYDQVSVGTEVLTLNHDTGLSEWQIVQQMNVFTAERRAMIEMEGSRFSALTTPHHRWPIVRKDGSRVWKRSDELSSDDKIPIAARNADLPTEPKWSDALVEVVGWYWTEGSYQETKGQISQSVKNAAKVERIRSALTALWGLPTQGWRSLSGCGQGGVGHDGVPRWNESAPSKQNGCIKFNLSAHAVRQIAEFAPGKAKVPTFAFLRSLTQEQLELFLHVSLLADNCGPHNLGQKNPAGADAFGFACLLAGKGTSLRVRTKVESREGWRAGLYTAYVARMRHRQYTKPVEASYRGSAVYRRTTYDGVIWCPTTANGSWLARRKGSVYFTGNSPSNVRTAQRGLNVTSNAIDFYIQEHQEILADAKTFEYEIAVAVDRAYFPKDKKSFYVAFGKEKGEVTYLPGELWKVAPKIKVRYNYAGLDANGIANLNGMKLGEGTKSKRAVMIEDPTITDVEEEEGRILEESINAGVLAGFNQQVASGAVSVADAAEVQVLVSGGDYTLAEAILEQQKRAQVRQASSGPPGTPAGPVPPGSPEAQQGLQAGPQGAAQPVQGPNPSQVNLKQLIQNLAGNSAAARG